MADDSHISIEGVSDTRQRFSQYVESFGPSARGLGWGNEDLMIMRLNQIVDAIVERGVSGRVDQVIDVGCGFGMLFHLLSSKIQLRSYIGVDFVERNIEYARTFLKEASVPEETYELHSMDFHHFHVAGDVRSQIVISGLFNHQSTDLRTDHDGQKQIQSWIDQGHVVFMNFLSHKATKKSLNLVYPSPSEVATLFDAEVQNVKTDFSEHEFLIVLESDR